MLALSRKENESLILIIPPSDQERTVIITVVEQKGCRVKLATEAPREIGVHRAEVWARIHGEDGHVCPDKI